MRRLLFLAVLACTGALTWAAQDTGERPIIKRGVGAKLAPMAAPLDCVSSTAQRGDPAKGPSVLLMELDAGCVVPWHWHTPNESLFPVSGLLQVQSKGDARPVVLSNGDYSYMPARHVHQAKCAGTKPCRFLIELDAPFDLHYVDKDGNEIAPERAVGTLNKNVKKAPKETP